MNNFFSKQLYQEDVVKVSKMDLPWDEFSDAGVLITGASGMIGSFLVDVLMYKNLSESLNCHVYALGRSEQNARNRFDHYWEDKNFSFIRHDIVLPLNQSFENLQFIFHLASNTHPVAYATDPIGTITTNVIGTQNLLNVATKESIKRFIFASSNEVYGENRGDVVKFSEDYCGYINSNTLRAGYPESKRCGEALCQAYLSQENVDIIIPRLTRTYGPTVKTNDSKAISQFLKNGVNNENVVLKSAGRQKYSFLYVADTVSGLLFATLLGNTGEAYNVSDSKSDVSLRNLAATIANISNTDVVFEEPDSTEKKGFSKATVAMLDSTKLQNMGWRAMYDISSGISRTISILKTV
ncbi:epimerase/dehydratase [Lacticaseibacillus paracasei subsp. paracasei Lpp126]|uniref:Epimerase/dehydratase n=1 Tax=Lacticaseibacillus paracasei subsp. paracasei Lpp126 TaxID=1256206 RepID=S2RWJ2_LACPA|nr:epimerase/dehydratase [Lacticaseibacillus paracasei subsp. paracasei Lpp126]